MTRSLDNVPKKCRARWGKCLEVAADALLDADENQRLRGDALVLVLTRLVLAPARSGTQSRSNPVRREVGRRCDRFLAGDWRGLWADSAQFAPSVSGAQDAGQRAELRRMRREEEERDSELTEQQRKFDYTLSLVRRGLLSKGLRNLTSQGVEEATEATAQRLRSMQFTRRASQRPAGFDAAARAHRPARQLLSADDVAAGISRAPRASGAGPSGWRYEFAKAAAEHAEGQRAMVAIVSRIAQGQFGYRPSTATHGNIINAARLIALKRGGGKIRPVAVGECLRRLAASCAVRSRRSKIEARCHRAKNLAFSADGANAGKKTIETLLQANREWICVETDLKSAFQRASREDILFELYDDPDLRDLIPLYLSLYDGDARLFFEEVCTMLSLEGSHQGCPMGGLLFILSVASIVERVQAAFPDVTIVGLADDYRFVGPVDEAMDAAQMYRNEVERAGHVFQADKSWLFSRSCRTLRQAARHPLAGVNTRQAMKVAGPSKGLRILGAPYGYDDWCKQWLADYNETVQKDLDAISAFGKHETEGSTQAAFLLLRFCASTKVNHLLRMVPPSLMTAAADQHDTAVMRCLSSLMNPAAAPVLLPVDQNLDGSDPRTLAFFDNDRRDLAAAQAMMPVVQGGLGLGCADVNTHAAYLSGWADYLRFLAAYPDLFPAASAALDPSTLAGSQLPAIVALQGCWDYLDLVLSRDSEDNPGTQIHGVLEMQQILGDQVSGIDSLHLARPKPQEPLSKAVWRATERHWMRRPHCTLKDKKRLVACGGREAGWVTAMPAVREYQLTNNQWRDSVSTRLHVPLSFLVAGPTRCDCHDSFDRRTGDIAQGVAGTAHRPTQQGSPRTRRPRVQRPPVDPYGEHEQRCGFAFSLGRHDCVQAMLERKTRWAGKSVRLATVQELRRSGTDPSQKKADLRVDSMAADGLPTILDVGITHSCADTYSRNTSVGVRGYAANSYGKSKDTMYRKIIRDKGLNLHCRSAVMETYGAFSNSLWGIITELTDRSSHPHANADYDPWSRPDPRRDFILSLGFAAQRGNSKMLRDANTRRLANRAGGRYATGARA